MDGRRELTPGSAAKQCATILVVVILAMSLWFSGTATSGGLASRWSLGPVGIALLTSSVQLGFVAGALLSAGLNLSDVLSPARLIGVSCLVGAGATGAVALGPDSAAMVISLRFITGAALACVYPVALRLVSSWFVRGRALAMGATIAALCLGSALPHLFVTGPSSTDSVLLAAAACAVVASLISLLKLREGPYATTPTRLDPRSALRAFQSRSARAVNFGYLGHMWELYAWWAWLPAWLSSALGDRAGQSMAGVVDWLPFAAIGVAGAVGCLASGWLGMRHGPYPVALGALAISGVCCLASPWVAVAPVWVIVAVTMIWGAAVIADSGQFSAALTTCVDERYVGSALTAQLALGFSVTFVTVQALPWVAELVGWRYTFLVLAVGPVLGVAAGRRSGCVASQKPSAEVVF